MRDILNLRGTMNTEKEIHLTSVETVMMKKVVKVDMSIIETKTDKGNANEVTVNIARRIKDKKV